MSRLLWIGLGAGAALYGVVKARQLAQHSAPKAIEQRGGGSELSVVDRATGFVQRVRAAMAEREAELRAELNLPAARSDRLGPAD
jgi:uncharacterized protein HemX